MTNKQYERLGRALCAEARLETMRSAMDGLCSELADNLWAIAGSEASKAWVSSHYGKQFSSLFGCRDFMCAVRDILSKEDKKVEVR